MCRGGVEQVRGYGERGAGREEAFAVLEGRRNDCDRVLEATSSRLEEWTCLRGQIHQLAHILE